MAYQDVGTSTFCGSGSFVCLCFIAARCFLAASNSRGMVQCISNLQCRHFNFRSLYRQLKKPCLCMQSSYFFRSFRFPTIKNCMRSGILKTSPLPAPLSSVDVALRFGAGNVAALARSGSLRLPPAPNPNVPSTLYRSRNLRNSGRAG